MRTQQNWPAAVERLVMVAPTISENALARALALAHLVSRRVEVSLLAWDDGPIWPGAGRWNIGVTPVNDKTDYSSFADASRVVWVCKPLPRAARITRRLGDTLGKPSLLLVDLDDDDAALSAELSARRVRDRVRLHPWHAYNPRAVRESTRGILARADGATHASEALIGRLAGRYALPAVRARIVHPRPDYPRLEHRSSPDGTVHIGFLGTIRPHKGFETIARLLASPGFSIHVFEGQLDQRFAKSGRSRIVFHPQLEPLSAIHSQLDLVLLPQHDVGGAAVQLPAKLLDALQAGVPVIATPTPAIVEIAADSVSYFGSWNDTDALVSEIHTTLSAAETLRDRALRRFAEIGSEDALVDQLDDFFERLLRHPGKRFVP